MTTSKSSHGGARHSTRSDAKPRGYAPDYIKRIAAIRAAIARYGVPAAQRTAVKAALEAAIDELDRPIIL